MAALLGSMADGDTRPRLQRWVMFFEHIAEFHRLYGALLGRTGSPWFANSMRATPADADAQPNILPDVVRRRTPLAPRAPLAILYIFLYSS